MLEIIPLKPEDFPQCGAIWDIEEQAALAESCLSELRSGNRRTWIGREGGAWLGEVSVEFDAGDSDYTVPGRRLYLSRLIVREDARRRGVGHALTEYAVRTARDLGYRELSLGVNLDNYPALRLYAEAGFDRILRVDRDQWGPYVKLLKILV